MESLPLPQREPQSSSSKKGKPYALPRAPTARPAGAAQGSPAGGKQPQGPWSPQLRQLVGGRFSMGGAWTVITCLVPGEPQRFRKDWEHLAATLGGAVRGPSLSGGPSHRRPWPETGLCDPREDSAPPAGHLRCRAAGEVVSSPPCGRLGYQLINRLQLEGGLNCGVYTGGSGLCALPAGRSTLSLPLGWGPACGPQRLPTGLAIPAGPQSFQAPWTGAGGSTPSW